MSTAKAFNWIRALSMMCLCGLFVADFGFDAMGKPVPREAYWLLVGLALGIDAGEIRDVFVNAARSWASKQ